MCSTAAGYQGDYLHQPRTAQHWKRCDCDSLARHSVLCLAAISTPTTTLATSMAPPAPSTSWPAAFAWTSCPTAPPAA
jgi:hypothetical protein